jgi:hypothetical protein
MSGSHDAILAAVRQWLDTHPGEPLPAGLDPAAEATPLPDLLTLAQAVVACRHDLQLQGKVLKRVEEKLDGAAGRTVAVVSSDPGQAAVRTDLIDVFDRLRRCHAAARQVPPGASTPMRAHLEGIEQAMAMTLARTQEALGRLGLRVFDPLGDVFDGARMMALATAQASAEVPAGCVAEVVRVGFLEGGAMARLAEVRVAR